MYFTKDLKRTRFKLISYYGSVIKVNFISYSVTILLGQIRQCLHFFNNLNMDSECAMQGACNALGYGF